MIDVLRRVISQVEVEGLTLNATEIILYSRHV